MIENVARANPIVLTYMPFIEFVIKPNICSTRARIFDFFLLFSFCSSVSGLLR